jgi:hypothetical protein
MTFLLCSQRVALDAGHEKGRTRRPGDFAGYETRGSGVGDLVDDTPFNGTAAGITVSSR